MMSMMIEELITLKGEAKARVCSKGNIMEFLTFVLREHRIQTYFDHHLLLGSNKWLTNVSPPSLLDFDGRRKIAQTPKILAFLSDRDELMLMEDKPDFQNRLEVVDAIGMRLELEAA